MPRLELLVAIVREPHRPAGKEHRRQRDVERERRVVAAAEAAAEIGEMRVDAGRLERRAPRRADSATDSAASCGDCTPTTSSRFLPPASYQARPPSGSRNIGSIDWVSNRGRAPAGRDCRRRARRGSARRRSRPSRIAPPACSASGAQTGSRRVLELAGADPALLDRRVDVRRVGRRAGHAREAIRAVGRHRDRAGFLAELHEGRRRAARAAPGRRRRTSRRSAAPPAGRDRAASCRPGRTDRRRRTRARGCRRSRDPPRSPRRRARSAPVRRERSMPA